MVFSDHFENNILIQIYERIQMNVKNKEGNKKERKEGGRKSEKSI
jgi:hypothetical protein